MQFKMPIEKKWNLIKKMFSVYMQWQAKPQGEEKKLSEAVHRSPN